MFRRRAPLPQPTRRSRVAPAPLDRPPLSMAPPETTPYDRQTSLPAKIQTPPVLDPDAKPVSEAFMLPPHQSKAGRMGDHLAALSADLREYVELRIALVQRKVEGITGKIERIQHLESALKLWVPAGVLALLGALFALLTMALGIGWLLGHPFWGFLVMTVLMLLTAFVLFKIGERRKREVMATLAEAKRVNEDREPKTVEQIADAQSTRVRQAAS